MIFQSGLVLVEELLRSICDDLESFNTVYGVFTTIYNLAQSPNQKPIIPESLSIS